MKDSGDFISREALLSATEGYDWASGLKTVLKRIPAADVRPRWIPVSERLPEKAGHYIVFVELKRNGQKLSAWTQVTWFFFGDFILECAEDEKSFVAAVTHWMPLPEPPKEET